MSNESNTVDEYKYLPAILHHVRWVQHFSAIIAEALILLAFLASAMDVSMGGMMANIAVIKWAWAIIFSLGIDTSFVISWVRCRQLGRSWHLLWSVPVALGISFVVFEPVVIQLYQQALSVDFNQALNAVGINLTVLVYARSGVAVFLGAILAMTNVESTMVAQTKQGDTQSEQEVSPPEQTSTIEIPADDTVHVPDAQVIITEAATAQVFITAQQDIPDLRTLQQLRAQKISEIEMDSLSGYDRVSTVLSHFPHISDRELGKLSRLSAATAKKHKEVLKRKQ
jgi:hypothetical protein